MSTVREEAMSYEKETTKNVCDLTVFDINMEMLTYEGVNNEGAAYKYLYVEGKDNVKYRVPYVVLGMIKSYLEENPDLTQFKVKKTGEGKTGTKYIVIPLTKV